MRIQALETLSTTEFENILWLKVHTDEGVVGLGETFFMPRAVEAYIHETLAPKLIGRDPLAIDRIAKDVVGYLGFRSSGIEMRGNSALDIALWDILGKVTGQPIAQLLGGFSRPSIRTYNTCAGPIYMRSNKGQRLENYGIGQASERYDDLNGFLERADDLAEDLLAEGITAMKIWPFDGPAAKTDGVYIAPDDLRTALSPFERIRKRVGDRMDVMVEFHSMWQLLPAMQIARALTPYGPYWLEDPIKMDSLGSLRRYAEASPVPICASETLATRWGFPRPPGDRRRRDCHARPVLVRRPLRGQEDRDHGRGVAPACRPARLHRPGGARGLDSPVAQRAERSRAGERARLLSDLVP